MSRIFVLDKRMPSARDAQGERLDKFLARLCTDLSRSRLQGLISDGYVTVDGNSSTAAYRLKFGQTVVLEEPEPSPSYMEPQHVPFSIVWEDDDVIVVDKPPGLTVHPAPGNKDRTLVNGLLARTPDLKAIGGTIRPGIVHRLDKNTSGLMVVAKNQKAHTILSEQVKAVGLTKGYTALIHGSPSNNDAVINAPLGRDPRNRKKMAVILNGKSAITQYNVIRLYEDYSLVHVKTTTGRTHQIRVHFASLGHPLVGDGTYGKVHPRLGRHFLHASLLGFYLPTNRAYVEFTSKLTDELEEFLDSLNVCKMPPNSLR